MKIITSKPEQGGTIAVVLVLSAVFGILLASFLTLLTTTNRATVRSEFWNTAVPIAEAGVDDALTHLNVNGATGLAKDGWAQVIGTTLYWRTNTLDGNTYLVTISNYVAGSTTNQPVIEARAYVPMNLASMPTLFVAAIGLDTPQKAYLARGVKVTTGQKNVISRGMISKGSLQFQNDGGIAVDSYDSTDPNHSTNGKYDATKRKPNGFIGTNSRISGNMTMQGTLKVLGMIGTGASGVLSIQSPASVGDLAWVSSSANNGKVKPGHLDSSLNLPFPDVAAPTGAFFTPSSGWHYDGTNWISYNYLLNVEGGKYRIDKMLLLGTDKRMYVNADATLYVTDTMEIDKGKIIIAPGKTLTLYVEKAFVAKGTAEINANGVPSQFFYFGRPQNTSFQVMDTAKLVGVFYAPSANGQFQGYSELSGGGTFGTLQMQHYFKFHYDEALGGSNKDRLFFVTSWNEMTPDEVEALPGGVSLKLP